MSKKELMKLASALLPSGYYLTSYSPGDGRTRYRIVAGLDDYFGGARIADAMGAREAETMVRAFAAGHASASAAPDAGHYPASNGIDPNGRHILTRATFAQDVQHIYQVAFRVPPGLGEPEIAAIAQALYAGDPLEAADGGPRAVQVAESLLEQKHPPVWVRPHSTHADDGGSLVDLVVEVR